MEHVGELTGTSAGERHRQFLSHQLFWDMQSMIEGFIGLVEYREQRWGGCAGVRARSCSQDSLESLFGRLRMACGSGQAVSMIKAVQALPREDARTEARWAARASTNSGRSGSVAPVSSGRFGLFDAERIQLPPSFKATRDAVLASAHAPTLWPVVWVSLRTAQTADQEAFTRSVDFRSRRFYWLSTEKHINKTGFSRMKVGLALDVMRFDTAIQLSLERYGVQHIVRP